MLLLLKGGGSPTLARAWTPADLGTKCWAWYDPTDTTNVQVSGSNVLSWTPTYGPGPKLFDGFSSGGSTPGETAAQADASTFNSKRSILLGARRTLGVSSGASVNGSAAFSVFQVLKIGTNPTPVSGGNVGRFFSIADIASGSPDWNTTNSTSWGPKKSDGYCEWYRNGEVFLTGTKNLLTTGVTLMNDCVQDGVNGHMYQDGALIGSDTSTSTFSSTAIAFGDMAQNWPSSGDAAGDTYYGDQIIAIGALTADEIARIQGYNAWKWGLQGDLPSSHPYKNAAPTVTLPAAVTLPLDFTTGSTPTGVTGSGAANGTRTNSSGVIVAATSPRFGYTSAGVTRGLIVEGEGQNQCASSNNLANSTYWSTYSPSTAVVVTANAAAAPDGTTTATRIATGVPDSGVYNVTPLTIAGVQQTSSCYVKYESGTNQNVKITVNQAGFGGSGGDRYVEFNASTGAFVGKHADISAYTIENAGGGVWRVSATYTPTVTIASGGCAVALFSGPSGTGAGTFLGWGFQTENGASCTTLVPTTSLPVARGADSISFTIPSAVTSLRFTFEDNTTQDVSVTGGTYYTIPTSLNGSRIKTVADANAGAGSTLAPASGAITYAGQTATVTTPQTLAPTAGAITYAGQTSTVTSPRLLAPASGAITYTGQTSTVTSPRLLAPAAGSITYSGQTSTVATPNVAAPAAGAIAYTGQTSTVTTPQTLAPAAGSIAYTGQTSTVTTPNAVAPAAGAIVYTGQTSSVTTVANLSPAAGAITYAGQTSTVTVTANNTLAPASGSFAYAGQTSTVTSPRLTTPASGAITYAGQTSTVTSTANLTLVPGTGSILYSGQTSTVTAGGGGSGPSYGVADGSVSNQFPADGVSYPYGTGMRVA